MIQAILGIMLLGSSLAGESALRLSSKHLTESIILSEMLEQVFELNGISALHEKGIGGGGTQVLFKSLVNGDIDVYPEYSGTLLRDLFSTEHFERFQQVEVKLASLGLAASYNAPQKLDSRLSSQSVHETGRTDGKFTTQVRWGN